MATTTPAVKPGQRVEIDALQSYKITQDERYDWLIGATGTLVSVDPAALASNEETGTTDRTPYQVRLDSMPGFEQHAGETYWVAKVSPAAAPTAPGEAQPETLRDRIAAALNTADTYAQLERRDDRERFADAVLPIVLAEKEQLRARVTELEARLERRQARLVALQNDADDMRGSLSPNGQSRKVPFPLGETLTPAVDWLIARVAELERIAAADRADIAVLEKKVATARTKAQQDTPVDLAQFEAVISTSNGSYGRAEEYRCRKCGAIGTQCKDVMTLADVVAVATRHECLPRT